MALNGTEHGAAEESDLKVELRTTPTLAHLSHLTGHVDGNTTSAWDDDNAPALPTYNNACTGQDGGFDQALSAQQANANKSVSCRLSSLSAGFLRRYKYVLGVVLWNAASARKKEGFACGLPNDRMKLAEPLKRH